MGSSACIHGGIRELVELEEDCRRGWRVVGLGVVKRKQLTGSVSVESQERKAEQIRRSLRRHANLGL